MTNIRPTMRVFVTGAAGFIASNLVDRLLELGHVVTGFDNFDPYYAPSQKQRNLVRAKAHDHYRFITGDVRNASELATAFDATAPETVVHLAARAGVRASVSDPLLYAQVNELGGIHVLLECQKRGNVPLVFASTSSVYGKTKVIPFREDDAATTPLSPYAASKRASELMAYSFNEVYRLPVCVLRFFTVYGPRGRPDMAFFKFSQSLLENKPIRLHGESTERDFTYVADIVEGIVGGIGWVNANRGFGTFNLGRSEPIVVRRVIELLGAALGRCPEIVLSELEPGEAFRTAADVSLAKKCFGYAPTVSIERGVELWVKWLLESPESPMCGKSGSR
jgi:UDP-glucuronate 4-epimerase